MSNPTLGARISKNYVFDESTGMWVPQKLRSDSVVSIGDGDDVTQGALADAVVAAGAVGSVSAKLRRLTTDLDALLTELRLKADLTETQPVRTRNALTASAPTAVSVGVASTVILAANANRRGCLLVNTSTAFISIAFGAAAVLYSGITLNSGGGSFWMDEYSFNTLEIRGIASVAASNIAVQEMTA